MVHCEQVLRGVHSERASATRLRFAELAHRELAVQMAMARVFVLPSRDEGLPLAILEAMAAGVPVVSTRVGGVPDLITDGVDGLLVAADDAPALADALRTVLASAELQEKFSRAGVRRVQAFTLAATASAYLDLYFDILGTRSSLIPACASIAREDSHGRHLA